MKVYLKETRVRLTQQRRGRVTAAGQRCERRTYSTCLDHSGGSLKVMNMQLVKIVHMMIMLNNVRRLTLRRRREVLLT